MFRCGRFGRRRRSTLTCCRRTRAPFGARPTRFSASSVALALKREARIPRISLNRSVIRMRAYAVRLLRLRRIEFSVHTPVAHELTHVIQQSCSLEAGILQRTCGQNNQQSFYAGAANYCKDTGFTGVLHPGKTCHREIPANPSACPPGDQVCFDADGNCSDSYDEVSTVGSKDASGGCVVNWKSFPGHPAKEIIPGLPELTHDLGLTSQSTLDCMKACDSKPWYTRPVCKVGFGAS